MSILRGWWMSSKFHAGLAGLGRIWKASRLYRLGFTQSSLFKVQNLGLLLGRLVISQGGKISKGLKQYFVPERMAQSLESYLDHPRIMYPLLLLVGMVLTKITWSWINMQNVYLSSRQCKLDASILACVLASLWVSQEVTRFRLCQRWVMSSTAFQLLRRLWAIR